MSVQNSVEVRNARLDADEATVGTGPTLLLLSGAQRADTATATAAGYGAAGNGTVIATIALPSDWLAAASAGVKSKLGTWQDTSADASGTIAHYELWDSAHTKCHEQGTVTNTGGGGDMTLDNVVVNATQSITIATWSKTAANA
jgi:hypothetical protein